MRQQVQARWLRTWWRWEIETESRHRLPSLPAWVRIGAGTALLLSIGYVGWRLATSNPSPPTQPLPHWPSESPWWCRYAPEPQDCVTAYRQESGAIWQAFLQEQQKPYWLRNYRSPYAQQVHMTTHWELHLLDTWLRQHQGTLQALGYPTDMAAWQNHFNALLLEEARQRGIPPLLYKALIAQESQFIPYPNNPIATGMAQITDNGIDLAFAFAPLAPSQSFVTWSDPWIQQAYQWTAQSGVPLVDPEGITISPIDFWSWQDYYRNLSLLSQSALRAHFLPLINGICDPREVQVKECASETAWRPEEWKTNLVFGMDALQGTEQALKKYMIRVAHWNQQQWQDFWAALSETEKWKFRVAVYNSGQACIGEALRKHGGEIRSWKDVVAQIDKAACGDAIAEEVEGVWHFLQGGP